MFLQFRTYVPHFILFWIVTNSTKKKEGEKVENKRGTINRVLQVRSTWSTQESGRSHCFVCVCNETKKKERNPFSESLTRVLHQPINQVDQWANIWTCSYQTEKKTQINCIKELNRPNNNNNIDDKW